MNLLDKIKSFVFGGDTDGRIVSRMEADAIIREFPFESGSVTKSEFFHRERVRLEVLVSTVNRQLSGSFDRQFCPLTLLDVAVVLNCEAGLKKEAGPPERMIIDDQYEHSDKERGLLPFSRSMRAWTNAEPPDFNVFMPLSQNLYYYHLYMLNIKNRKGVSGVSVHRDIFRRPKISSSPARQSRLVAGIIHGYFTPENYDSKRVPREKLIRDYQNDVPLAEMMQVTDFNTKIKPTFLGRQTNIAEALTWV